MLDKKYIMLLLLVTTFLISFSSAETWKYNYLDQGERVQYGLNYSINVNHSTTSDYAANSGLFDGYSVGGLWTYYSGLGNALWCQLTGCTMQGNIDMNGNDIDMFGGNIENVSHVQFNTAGNGCTDEFCMEVDADMGKLTYSLPGGNVVNSIGFETYFGDGRVRNTETFDIPNCRAVWQSGSTGQIPEVQITGIEKGYRIAQAIVGLTTEDITANQLGYVTSYGIVRECNTSAFSDGDSLFLSTNGTFTNSPLPLTNGTIFIGTVNRVHATEGEINVMIDKIPSIGDVLYSGNDAEGQDILGVGNINASGDLNVGGDITGSNMLLEAGGNTLLNIKRPANTNAANIRFITGGTNDWIFGTRATGDSDFHLYSYGTTSDVLVAEKTTGDINIYNDLNIDGSINQNEILANVNTANEVWVNNNYEGIQRWMETSVYGMGLRYNALANKLYIDRYNNNAVPTIIMDFDRGTGNVVVTENITANNLQGNNTGDQDLSEYAKYQFLNNNFNGSGNFTTTGDIIAPKVYSADVDGNPDDITLSSAGTSAVNGDYPFQESIADSGSNWLVIEDAYVKGTPTAFGDTYLIIMPTSIVTILAAGGVRDIYSEESLDSDYAYAGKITMPNPPTYSGFTDYYKILLTDLNAGVDNWVQVDGALPVPSTAYEFEQVTPFKLDENGITTQLDLTVGNKTVGKGTITSDIIKTDELEHTGGTWYFNPNPLPTGAGTRFMWLASDYALRAGKVTGAEWDSSNIGEGSVAFGQDNTASGSSSFASGYDNNATNIYSVAFGSFTQSTGYTSVSTGYKTTASASYSTAMGRSTTASGQSSTAMGYNTTASGSESIAMGKGTTASGYNSVAMGYYTNSSTYSGLAIGRYNVGGGASSSQWIATDPLFEIGIGTGVGSEANALTILKNGESHWETDQKHYYGLGDDAYSQYDGTNWIFNPKAVGSGIMKILGSLWVTEDLNVSGNITANEIYGSISGDEIGDVVISSSGVYYNVTNTTAGLLNGFAFNTTGQGGLTAQVDGVYELMSGWSFSGTANNEYHLRIAINGQEADNCHAQRKIGTGGDVGSASTAPCFVQLNVGDVVTTQIENVDSATDATIHDIGMTIKRIGN